MTHAYPVIIAAFFLIFLAVDRHRQRTETKLFLATITELCLRIQAPEQAVIERIAELPSPPAVSFDDDAAFWLAREQIPQDAE